MARIGRRVKRILSLIVSLVMMISLINFPGPIVARAAAGDVPAHSKTLTPNNDGTYQLALNITGENEKIINKVNVIVILDVSSSMNSSAGTTTRIAAAKSAINNLANTLLSLNGQGENPNDAVEMALVTFGNTATTLQNPTTSQTTFTSRVSGITIPTGVGTNWEAAMQQANTVSFNDTDQTFVIFVSDGNPTFRYTEGNYPNHNNDYNQQYYNQYGVWGSGQDSGAGSGTTIARCYEHAVDDATTLATKVGGTNFYTIGAYGNVDRMQSLTTAAGAPSGNYFSASNTTELQEALASILEDIQTAGIGAASINDPTTTDVVVSSDVTAHLLKVDEGSFKYYKNGVEWSDAPPASLDENGNVVWDLKSVGILDNNVTYTVTFDVWPTQETYDMIADLENGDLDYDSDVPEAIKEYLIKNTDGSYTLKTNKDFPTITYTDTRTDDGPQTVAYTNPDPVPTEVSEMNVSKLWYNDLDWRGDAQYQSGFTMDLTRDGAVCDSVTVKPDDWSDSVYISTGLMRVHYNDSGAITGIEVLEDGHDYTLVEPENMTEHWELVVETIHPMLINGQLTSLVEVLEEDIPEGMGSADFYTLAGVDFYRLNNGKVYKENGQGQNASVSAYNERKSNLNLMKVVDGEDAPEDELFEYSITVTDPNGDDLWFSVVSDPENPDTTLVKDLETTATPEAGDTGYFYFSSGSTITVKMQAGWNLRFTNLPTGTTYTIVETTDGMSTGFTFDSANGDTPITVSELPDGAVDMGDGTYSYDGIIYTGDESSGYTFTYQPDVEGATVDGEVVAPNGSYQVTYTNLYSLTDVEITKVWEDNDDQDGIRPTAEEFKSYLKLLADGEDVTEANADKLEVTDNKDGTFSAKWTAVQRFKENTTTQEEIVYTVEETEIEGYSTEGSPAEDGGTITNEHTPEETTVKVLKVWDDSDDIGEIRPESIDVQLMAGEEEKGEPVTLDEENEWSYTWEELPKNADGEEIAYTVVETEVPTGYTSEEPVVEEGDEGFIVTITNTYSPVPVSVDPPVQKIILNNDDLYNKGNFTFTIEPTSPTSAPMPAKTSITNVAANEVAGKTGFYEFGEIVFTVPGTYVYTVKESGSAPGVTNDPAALTGKTLTFEVTDDGTGKLVVSPTTDQVQLSFTNTYDASGEATIVVNKTISGAGWPANKTLTFTIAGADGAPMPETTTATLNAVGSVSFGPIAYSLDDVGESYEYTITEDGFGDGWTGNPDEVKATVTVSDNGDGTLKAEVVYFPTTSTINNDYVAEGEAEIEVIKALEGAGWPEGKTLTFTLSGGEGAPMPATTEIEISEEGTVNFGPIAFDQDDAGKTYTYSVSEDGFGSGWSSSGSVNVEITVTDNGDGTLSTEVVYDPEDQTITNTYVAEGTAQLQAIKAISGAGWPEGKTITFTLSGEGGTLPATKTVTLDKEGTAVFDVITYDQDDAGKTFTYTISEDGFGKGWTGSGDVTATVRVIDNGDGTLATEISYSPENKTITNTYVAEGEAVLEVKKAVEGADWPEDAVLTFTLSGQGGTLPATKTVTLDEEGTATFGAITYTEEDIDKEYTYTIDEDGFGEGWTSSGPVTATVKVTDNGDGTLATTITYSPEDDTITNTYEAEGKADLEVVKEISGAAWPEGKTLTFTLSGEGGTLPETKTATLTAPGTAKFGSITYDESDAGKTYTYTITEDGFGEGWTGSGNVTATVKVTDNGDGTLATEITYSPDNKTITNTYEAEGEIELEVIKELSGASWPEGKTLTFTLSGEGGTLPETKTATLTAPGTAKFGAITYDELDAGKTYTYTITEDGFGEGWSGSGPVTATVKVTDNGNGTLDAAVTYSPGNDTIVNTYVAEGEAELKVVKALEGAGWPEGKTLTFTVTGANDAPMPEKSTVTLDSEGTASFGKVAYTEADAGKTYSYTISEDGFGTGWTASGDVTATVVVSDNGDGTLKAEVSYSPEDDTITNTYEAEGEAVLKVTKAIVGADWPEGKTLTFTLSGEGGTLPETKTVSLSAPGTATFGAITYTEEDIDKEYTYTISEDGFGSGWTSSGSVTATVKVTDNGDGTLAAAITYAPASDTIINTYSAEGDVTLEASKELVGREWIDGETVTFTLLDPDGNVLEEKTIGENGTITFTTIEYDQDDLIDPNGGYLDEQTYEYTISETSELPSGVTKSADITATVTITDNGDGTLETSVEYTNDGTIINTYEASPVEAEINVFKQISGYIEGEDRNGNVVDRTFNFEMTGPKIEDKLTTSITTSGGTGSATFDKIKYEFADMVDDEGNQVTKKEFTYQVTETAGSDAGFTYDTATYNVVVTVEDDQNGKLVVTDITKATDTHNVNVVNTFEEESVDVILHLHKTIQDLSNSAPDATFTFQLLDADGGLIEETTITTSNLEGDVDFAPLTFEKAGEYNFTLQEIAKIKVVESSSSESSEESSEEAAEGTEEAAEETEGAAEEASGEEGSEEAAEGTEEAAAEEEAPAAEEESEEPSEAWTFDTKAYPVVITVSDNFETAELEADVTIDGEDTLSLTVTNIYKAASTKVELKVTKEIEDRSGSAYETTFEFTLTGAEGAPMPETTTVTVKGEGTVSFGEIEYEQAGEYSYTIAETAGDAPGYTYDASEYPVIVTVEDIEGKLNATVDYGEKDATSLTVTNIYEPEPAEATPQARKVVDDQSDSAPDETFTFQLIGPDGVVETVTRQNGGYVYFSTLTFDTVGTYEYTIQEVSGSTAGYTYDTEGRKLQIVVTDDEVDGQHTGILSAAITYLTDEGEAVITNPYKADPTSVVIDVTKIIDTEIAELKDQTFEFTLTDIDGNVEQTLTITGAGTASFDEINFEKAGIYNYIVKETDGQIGGYTYDPAVYLVTVSVTDEGGKLVADCEILKDEAELVTEITFTNLYEASPVTIELEATKILTGRDLKAAEFQFQVLQGSTLLAEATNNADGTVIFSPIEFTQVGTYTLTVKEVAGTDPDVTYDTTEYTVKVVVSDGGDGKLVAEVTGGDELVFKNTVPPPEDDNPPPPDNVPTGDNSNMAGWLAAMIGAGAAGGGLLVYRKKKKDEEAEA